MVERMAKVMRNAHHRMAKRGAACAREHGEGTRLQETPDAMKEKSGSPQKASHQKFTR